MILCVPTLRASSDALLFIRFLFFMTGDESPATGSSGQIQATSYQIQATSSPVGELVACQGFFRARLYLTWVHIYGTILI